MTTSEAMKEFESVMGYSFRDQKILKRALTHSSFSNERRYDKMENNERLEFLGDAVLELVSSEFLFQTHKEMQEGDLTRLRASLVCEPTLAYCARSVELGKYLLLGKGEAATGGRDRDSILSDALEAVIGAIFLDGGFTSAKEFVLRFVLNDIEHKKLFFDSKTILQEIIQGEGAGTLSYDLVSEEGPDHNKKFTVVAKLDGTILEKGIGRTKKAAEQNAAYKTILKMKESGKTTCI